MDELFLELIDVLGFPKTDRSQLEVIQKKLQEVCNSSSLEVYLLDINSYNGAYYISPCIVEGTISNLTILKLLNIFTEVPLTIERVTHANELLLQHKFPASLESVELEDGSLKITITIGK